MRNGECGIENRELRKFSWSLVTGHSSFRIRCSVECKLPAPIGGFVPGGLFFLP